ncbi:endonuclease MutS2 [bacterium BMS3Abin05]|nr:endonuclease MutS2 [bacterium BMS3Abin05]GBE27003.1 endonuclease MutS2 [bacterium BMS3Bbin03]HDZ11583.1 hypothetical protein [Bacteroidota bacterium]
MFNFWKRKKTKPDTEFETDENTLLPKLIEVTDVLDLHGFFPEEIPQIIDSFIENALELKLCEVKIIHGKGRSKLKWIVLKMLDSHSAVVDYYDAPSSNGGWGATIVELRPLNRKPVKFSNRIVAGKNHTEPEPTNSPAESKTTRSDTSDNRTKN